MIDKPVIMMNAEGFRIFMEMVTGASKQNEEAEVDNVVKTYLAHTPVQPQPLIPQPKPKQKPAHKPTSRSSAMYPDSETLTKEKEQVIDVVRKHGAMSLTEVHRELSEEGIAIPYHKVVARADALVRDRVLSQQIRGKHRIVSIAGGNE